MDTAPTRVQDQLDASVLHSNFLDTIAIDQRSVNWTLFLNTLQKTELFIPRSENVCYT